MSHGALNESEFAGLVEDVLRQLARDPEARHLWQWQPRPDCADEPAGLARRNHLRSLLGLIGVAALPSVAGACSDSSVAVKDSGADGKVGDSQTVKDDASRADGAGDGSALDASAVDDSAGVDLQNDQAIPCGDDPCATPIDQGVDKNNAEIGACADDPCGCADDPCGCADDPCGCADDPCGCADDPCGCADDPCAGS